MPSSLTRREMLHLSAAAAGAVLLPSFKARTTMSPNNIILRTIPSTGEKIPAIGMGTWLTFDAGDSVARRKQLSEVLRIFREGGGKVIDSSPMYGSSEKVVGDLVEQEKSRNDLFFATKVWTTGQEDGINQMNQSFQKMKTKTMDLLQVHNLVDVTAHMPTLKKWKADGKLRYIGITHYVVSAYPDLIRVIKKDKPDFVQFNYNIRVREAEKELLPFCQDNGIAVINNRPFDGGNLFNAVQGKPLPGWTSEQGITNWAQYFLKYIISHPAVTCAIPATSNPAHMRENIGALSSPLPDQATRRKMSEYFDRL